MRTVLQQGKYLTNDCIYKMTFVPYELLKYCLQARHMVKWLDDTIEFRMLYILVTSSEDVVYSQTVKR